MRRKDREITAESRIIEVLMECECCRLGFYDGGEVYIVPLDFGYEDYGNKKVLYFHGANKGRKASLIEKATKVGFEMDTSHETIEGENACGYSSQYRSIIVSGKIIALVDEDEKKKGLNSIMKKKTGRDNWEFEEGVLKRTNVYMLEIEKMTCKENIVVK